MAIGGWLSSRPGPGPKVALIQGSIDITMKMDERQTEPDHQAVCRSHWRGDRAGRRSGFDRLAGDDVSHPWFIFDGDCQPPADWGVTAREAEDISRDAVRYWTGSFGVPILLGIDTDARDRPPKP